MPFAHKEQRAKKKPLDRNDQGDHPQKRGKEGKRKTFRRARMKKVSRKNLVSTRMYSWVVFIIEATLDEIDLVLSSFF